MNEQRIQPQAYPSEPGGGGEEMGGDLRPSADEVYALNNLVVVNSVAYLILSWAHWDEEGFYALGFVA